MYETVLFIHLVAVSLWLGGQLFLLAVVVPALRGEEPVRRAELFRVVGQQYLVVSIPVLVVILASGGYLAGELRLFARESPAFDAKLTAVAVVLASTVAHVVASRRGLLRASRLATATTGISTLVAVWLAVRI